MTQTAAHPETATDADADQIDNFEKLRQFHDEVRSQTAMIVSARKDLHHAEQLVKDRKASLKQAEEDLTAYINDDKLPLLGANGSISSSQQGISNNQV